jgi:hypothetical protein
MYIHLWLDRFTILQTRASAMRGRRLTTWAMARPCLLYSYGSEQTIIYFSRALQIVCWRSDLKWDCVVARLSFVRPGISRMSLQNTCFFPLHLVLCKTEWIVQYYVGLLSAFKRKKTYLWNLHAVLCLCGRPFNFSVNQSMFPVTPIWSIGHPPHTHTATELCSSLNLHPVTSSVCFSIAHMTSKATLLMGPHVFSNKWILPLRFTKPLFIVDWKRETGMYSLQVSLPCECNRRHSFGTDVAFLQHCTVSAVHLPVPKGQTLSHVNLWCHWWKEACHFRVQSVFKCVICNFTSLHIALLIYCSLHTRNVLDPLKSEFHLLHYLRTVSETFVKQWYYRDPGKVWIIVDTRTKINIVVDIV